MTYIMTQLTSDKVRRALSVSVTSGPSPLSSLLSVSPLVSQHARIRAATAASSQITNQLKLYAR